jgi:glutaminyl-peptide cyclotransferase
MSGGLGLAVVAALSVLAGCRRGEAGGAGFSGREALKRAGELVKLERHYEAASRGRAIAYIEREVKPFVGRVERQALEATERRTGKRYALVNIVARQNPDAQPRILIGSHWDSRLWAEEDPDPGRRGLPIPGANDSGSGVAVLLELARHTGGLRGFGIDYVFFDGEEMGRPGDNQGYCQGAEYFARTLPSYYPAGRPRAALVIDMVGDRSLDLYQEVSSLHAAPALVRAIWEQAAAMKAVGWHARPRHHIIDDHTPFQKLGIPSALIIDYDYPHWHTHADTLDKLSAESLGSVGAVLLNFLKQRQRAGWPP